MGTANAGAPLLLEGDEGVREEELFAVTAAEAALLDQVSQNHE